MPVQDAPRSRSSIRRRWTLLLAVFLVIAILPLASCTPSSTEGQAGGADSGASERALAPSGQPYSEDRAACAERDPNKQAFWGELHVHSSLSMDAWLWDLRGGPDQTYQFASGEETRVPPLDASGNPTRPIQLERPLDFVALTDHASFQGEVALCTRPGSAIYDSEGCRIFRAEVDLSESPFGEMGARMGALSDIVDERSIHPTRNRALCGEDGEGCREAMRMVWREQQAAAERHYDRSAQCKLTTFHAYEYTATPGLAKVHHNVIFRNANVPASPIPYVDVPDVYDMWKGLDEVCLKAGIGCDVITLPHNSNLSNGHMFAITGQDLPLETQRARALLRAEIEVLAEISQIKGDSECRNNMFQVMGAPDEFCEYEEWRPARTEDCGENGTDYGALFDRGCVSRKDYVRYALLEGFAEQKRLGVNPFKLGIIAATDQHMSNPGDTEEYSWDGWQGSSDATSEQRLEKGDVPVTANNSLAASPGGLAGVWAEENSRDALFDAMKRKETFGTSGTRMTARFFGGWEYDENLCGSAELVESGYAGGVPMGGDLPERPEGANAPVFVVQAMRDPGIPEHPGGLLQRAQIVKGWVDGAGYFHQQVYDVAGGANGASVDFDTCQPKGVGHNTLCSVWRDPAFDPGQRAVYYLRVLENPTCRWNQIQCLEMPAGERPAACSDPTLPKTIQERLWTSPIWYEGREKTEVASYEP